MREHDLELLELPAVLARLAAAADSEPGAARAESLQPSTDAAEVRLWHEQTAEAIALLDAAEEPDLGGIVDVRDAAALAARGTVLDTHSLAAIDSTIRAGVAGSRAVTTVATPSLAELGAAVDPTLLSAAEEIGRTVEEDGSDLRDSASPDLRRLRRQLRDGRGRLAERLRKIARDPSLADYLQDDFVTERGGRPVLALKASARGKVPGIVHDSSGSGQTLFVEPLAAVDDSNRLREAEAAERDEVTRILRNLSRLVGGRAAALTALVEAAAALDLAFARGKLSRSWRGARVARSDNVALRGVRHPLLDRSAAVPIDLELGELRALVISGPNTGGKTVALKTLGLAATLHQCGIRPPAEEASLPVFDQILVDIGDEQSIAMSLSTFSAHVRNLIGILDLATGESLVLLDELTAGTDPVEGAALAEAMLAQLSRQARLTVVTSHYAELKEWASAANHAANAATAIDPVSNEPLYAIQVGRPGSSHALQTAQRLGLPEAIVVEARSKVAPERLRVAALVAEAEASARDADAALEAAARERERATDARAAAERAEQSLLAEVEQVRSGAAEERRGARAAAEAELADARAEIEALRAEIRAARKLERERGRAAAAAGQPKERARDRRLGAASKRATSAALALRSLDEPLPLTAPLAVGDPVVAPEIGVRGTVAEIAGSDAVVLGPGGLRVRVPLDRLAPDRHAGAQDRVTEGVTVRAMAQNDVPDEVDLRGRTAQEAREVVRDLVDAAALAGRAEVRVIHGRGTGAVRKAVREELAHHPLVDEQVPDSADGATIVRLGGG